MLLPITAAASTSVTGLEFDEAAHKYYFQGRWVPNVTSILERAGYSDFSMVPPDILRRAQERGTAVHKACWYSDQDDLDEDTLDPIVVPYLQAWRIAVAAMSLKIVEIEKAIFCPRYWYAGTYDRWAYHPRYGWVLIDIKTGDYSESWKLQTAAYLRAKVKHAPTTANRLVLQLKANATFQAYWFPATELVRDWEQFVNCLGS